MKSLYSFTSRVFLGGLLGLLVLGCGPGGPGLVPVSGTVLLDGQPVEGAQVMFAPSEGRPATGTTDAGGKFTLGTFAPGDGAIPGSHAVSVVHQAQADGSQAEDDGLEGDAPAGADNVTWLIAPMYANPKTSGISVEVARGMSPVTLEVSSP